jgi:hypothetical protein
VSGALAAFFGEEDVVVLARVEGRVEVNEVNALGRDVAAQYVEIVAIEELIFRHKREKRRVAERRGWGIGAANRCRPTEAGLGCGNSVSQHLRAGLNATVRYAD